MRKTRFLIDIIGEAEFEGFTEDYRWNGFACPYFTFDQAQCIVSAWQEAGNAASYDKENDEFMFEIRDGEHDRFGPIEIEGLMLYPIGAACWIWDESPTINR
jgi:hypothetical protein